MSNKPHKSGHLRPLVRPTKDIRVVVRITTDDDQWLREEAIRTDNSVGRVMRNCIKAERLRREGGGNPSFNFPALQVAGLTD